MALLTRVGSRRPRPRHVAIIVVTYRSAGDVDRFFSALPAALAGTDYSVIVVDNDSPDDTVERLRAHDATVIESGGNYGYAAGVNIALEHLPPQADAVAVLNPDLEALPGSLSGLVDALIDPAVGIAVPRVIDEDGHLFASLFVRATLLGAFGDAVFGAKWADRPQVLSERVHRVASYAYPHEVAWASGAAWVLPRHVLDELGSWDESYFLYSEETEYARRVTEAGYQVRYVPEAVVRHREGGSGTSPELVALASVNRVRDFARWNSRPRTSAYRGAQVLRHGARFWKPGDRAALRTLVSARARAQVPSGDLPRPATRVTQDAVVRALPRRSAASGAE